MTELTFSIVCGALLGFNVFTLLLNQFERYKAMERELILVKALKSETVQELKFAEESPSDNRKRMKIEDDLAIKAEKLEEWKAARKKEEVPDRVPVG